MKLFVGSLPYSVNDEDLRDLFQDHGEVKSAKVIMDRDTGRSRGFGFVEMGSEEEGQKAIQALDGSQVSGRPIAVKKANDRR